MFNSLQIKKHLWSTITKWVARMTGARLLTRLSVTHVHLTIFTWPKIAEHYRNFTGHVSFVSQTTSLSSTILKWSLADALINVRNLTSVGVSFVIRGIQKILPSQKYFWGAEYFAAKATRLHSVR